MSILTKANIIAKANEEALLGNDFLLDNIKSCSYDLRIGTVYKNGKIYSNDFNPEDNWNIEVEPSEIVTMLTLEEVNLPKNITATVFAMNSLSSIGLLILNPGHIDPGFKGPISICAINLSKNNISLTHGKNIFTIIFEKLDEDAEPYKSPEYQDRKKREKAFYQERAKNLSHSFFDLISNNDYKPFRKVIVDEILKLSYKSIAWIVAAALTAFSLIEAYNHFRHPDTSFEKKLHISDSINTHLKQKDSVLTIKFDSLLKQNNNIKNTITLPNEKKRKH